VTGPTVAQYGLPVTPPAFARDVRLERLFAGGPALIVAWAHALLIGVGRGFDRRAMATLADDFAEADGLLLSASMMPGAKRVLSRRDRPAVFMLQHWQSITRPATLRGYAEGSTARLMDVDDAARWGADGVMTYLYVGWKDPDREAREIEYVSAVAARCRELGLLHMVESCLVDEDTLHDEPLRARMAIFHARLAAELGADIVKTRWTEPDSFRELVEYCPVPVVLAGGTPRFGFDEAIAEVQRAIDVGASGLVYGRYIFQHEDPRQAVVRLMEALRAGSAEPVAKAGLAR
jgi:DhnA family fructose-bisphosphate aldolase class Ia